MIAADEEMERHLGLAAVVGVDHQDASIVFALADYFVIDEQSLASWSRAARLPLPRVAQLVEGVVAAGPHHRVGQPRVGGSDWIASWSPYNSAPATLTGGAGSAGGAFAGGWLSAGGTAFASGAGGGATFALASQQSFALLGPRRLVLAPSVSKRTPRSRTQGREEARKAEPRRR